MTNWMDTVRRTMTALLVTMTAWLTLPGLMLAQEPAQHAGGEANLVLPDLGTVSFLGGTSGRTLLMFGLLVAGLGLVFGLVTYSRLRNLPVHKSMLEVSELIYETCKTYLLTQGKFLMILWALIAVVIAFYFAVL
ncbi:MAG TPA: sodium/proton-translocating pyrophosphatase, partial [Gemmatimonadales bacterium]|nr:sodium/proton-translocating pyrophosphatase [Gemmatimonadales bacterium]